MKNILLIIVVALAFSSCNQNKEDRAEAEAENKTTKKPLVIPVNYRGYVQWLCE